MLPTFLAAGAVAGALAAITPALPAPSGGLKLGDILLMFLETANQVITIPTPNGGVWTEVPDSPQGVGTAAATTASRLTAFWSRYVEGQGNPTTSDSGEHNTGVILAFRRCRPIGTPIDVTAGNAVDGGASQPAKSVPGDTTTVKDCLVVLAMADNLDNAGARHTSWINADLANLTERVDGGTTQGNGGGIGVATGEKATAGAYGNTTGVISTSIRQIGQLSIALIGQEDGVSYLPVLGGSRR